MLRIQLEPSNSIQKLINEGYEVELTNSYLILHHIPYLNQDGEICYGELIDTIRVNTNNEIVDRPNNHIIFFNGSFPHKYNRKELASLRYSQNNIFKIGEDNVTCFGFSNCPGHEFDNYYDKFLNYIPIITNEAKALNQKETAKTWKVVTPRNSKSVLKFEDTNAHRAGFAYMNARIDNHKIAIVGLGGTGSYILDFLSKTNVSEIHLFDGDEFLQHNALRSPGGITQSDIEARNYKVDYYKNKYSGIREAITSHAYYITEENLNEFRGFDFVFLCVDGGNIKTSIINYLMEYHIDFIDSGIGLNIEENKITGMISTTLVQEKTNNTNLKKYINTINDEDLVYSSNIQTVEVNALAAALAIIKWKQTLGFYINDDEYDTSAFDIGLDAYVREKRKDCTN